MRGHWCDIIFWMCLHQMRIKGKTEEASFYEELQQVFDQLPMDHIKIMLREFNAILESEHLYNPTFGNESWHDTNSANSVRVVNYATSRNMLRAQNCSIKTVINTPGPVLKGRHIMTLITYWYIGDGSQVFQWCWMWYWSLSGGCRSLGETVST